MNHFESDGNKRNAAILVFILKLKFESELVCKLFKIFNLEVG